MSKLNKFSNIMLFIFSLFVLPCLAICFNAPFRQFVNVCDSKNLILLICFYSIIAIFLAIMFLFYNDKKVNKKFYLFVILLILNLILRFINMEIKSGDYNTFLSEWVESYRNMPLKDCFATQVGNYSPPYNYFLILISRIPFNDLYLIKILSFIFELLTAYFVTKLIAHIKKEKFNILIFICILFVPMFFINSVVWAQCDSIYTFFSFMAIYFAVKNKSKLSFMFFGLSLCFKFQSIILFPVALILLLCKDYKNNKILKWKDIWVAPLTYIGITSISMFFGKSFSDAFLIYFEQSVTYNKLSSGCPNLANIIFFLDNYSTFKILAMIVLIALTLCVLTYILIRYIKKRSLNDLEIINVSFLITFFVVLLMPKMLDRYFYLSNIFAVVLMFCMKDKIYKQSILITLISSSVAHMGSTPYYTLTNQYLMVYSCYICSYFSSIANVISGGIIAYIDNKNN